jgi:serine/threonine-protein kinase
VELTPGTILLGKYRVDEILGTGGMGRVVRASHQYLAQSVAIKILLPQMAESPSTVARFLREAQATVKLKNEHVARVIDVGTMPDGTPFMVIEYLEGNDLNQILRHHGPQPPAVVVDLMLQACEGLAEAHAIGIVHRDIKPSNFFITRKPDGSMLLKILDFGISKTPVGFEELTGTQTVIGTPSYMAPEQMKSGRQADARSDIWSMGVVMYQLLQGRPPFQGESYAELVLKVGADPPSPLHVPLPPGLGEVIFKCLEKDPKARQQNVGELARMLAPFSSDPVVASQIASRTARILQHQSGGGGVQGLPIASGGGLATPVPISPAQLTPRSWPPSTSQSLGRGQQTMPVRNGRGWLIGGAFSLALLAAAGGYIASELMQKKSEPAAASAGDGKTVQMPAPTPPAPAPAPAPPPPAAAAKVEPPPAPAVTDEVPASSTWKPQAVQPTIVPKTEPPKPEPKTAAKAPAPAKTETKAPAKTVAKTTAAKPETKPPAKTTAKTTKSVAKTTAKTTTKTKTPAKTPAKTTTKKSDLFDSRK